MGWIRSRLRQLRWQLTISYTAVTVVSLLVVVMIVAGIFFTQILLPDNVMTPNDWVEIAREQSQFPFGELLSDDIPDPEVFSRILRDFDPVIVSRRLLLFSDLEIYARSTGVIDILITDNEGRLIAATHRSKSPFLEDVAPGEKFDPGLVPGLEKPLSVALQGRFNANEVYYEFEDGDGFLMAIPVFHPKDSGEVVGVVVYNVSDLSTEDDRGTYLFTVFLRSFVVIMIVAAMVGATFGTLTAEGLAGRFDRLASAGEAWSRGEFSIRIRDESNDEIGQLAGRLDGMAQELEKLVSQQQALAVAEERGRLARDLHDSAKQLALAASFQIAAARELFDRDPQNASAHLVEAEKLVDSVRGELTDLIHELRPAQMDGREFKEVLQTYATEWAHSSEIGVQLDFQDVDGLPLEVEEALYRIAQEALANVARHSGARQAFIQVQQHDAEVQMSVRDDGLGFTEESHHRGMGLSSMRERAEVIGGFTRISSQPGVGTEVRVVLPLAREEAENG